MPVVVPPTDGALLAQGDILKGVSFALVTEDGKLEADTSARYVMVLSRNCNALRDQIVTAAPISSVKFPTPPDTSKLTLDSQRRMLQGIAEGGSVQDTFYLGPLDETKVRYGARLGTLASIRLPRDEGARATWVAAKRVWSLDRAFIHDLHFRLFASYSRLGFDDHAWFPDPDLDLLISAGEAELAGLQKEASEAEVAYAQNEADGRASKPQQAGVEKKRESVAALQDRLAPYLAERETRRQNTKG